MRLATIKLAGFKSFVDPTVLHLPTNMTAIVGPNGCGKSNIIDAVRWVMGESSASRLRGDALTDVIFSGASSRKPVSQAVVELIFDNSDQTIAGEYARFNEISVKRQVNRDGNSVYFLNDTRCRRKDVTDLFLGTGLGPRSYAIIEQGMISRIIEARPEELRVYLEEAAGISKYKERRRETENRMHHTRDNLERLSDVRQELAKQLETLKRQAKQAEQYQSLQQERRLKDAQWRVLQMRNFDSQHQIAHAALSKDQAVLDQQLQEQQDNEQAIAATRVQLAQATEQLSKAQAAVYAAEAELARILQQIQHQKELSERLEQAHGQTQSQLGGLMQHIGADTARFDTLCASIEEAQPRLSILENENKEKQQLLHQAEVDLQQWQKNWEAHTQTLNEQRKICEVERTRSDYLAQQLRERKRRQEQCIAEREKIDLDALHQVFLEVETKYQQAHVDTETLNAENEQANEAARQAQTQQRSIQELLAQLRQKLQSARGRLASLEALQQAALGQEKNQLNSWLQKNGLEQAPRVGAQIAVDIGWETAVEAVLGTMIEGVIVEEPLEHWKSASEHISQGHVCFVSSSRSAPPHVSQKTSLAHKVQGPSAIREFFIPYHAAENAQIAETLLAEQSEISCVVTIDGTLYGRGWVRKYTGKSAHQGTLVREREIQGLRTEVQALATEEQTLQSNLDDARTFLLSAEQNREKLQRQLYAAHRLASEYAGQRNTQHSKLESARTRCTQLDVEVEQLHKNIAEVEQQAGATQQRLENATSQVHDLEQRGQELKPQQHTCVQTRDQLRAQMRQVREQIHALTLSLESWRVQKQSLTENLKRMTDQRAELDARLDTLHTQLKEGEGIANTQLVDAQQEAQHTRSCVLDTLKKASSHLEDCEQQARTLEHKRQQSDSRIVRQRECISQRMLELQALTLHIEQLNDAITAAGFDGQALLQDLEESAQPDVWEKEITHIDARIRRLEPVNLAAIEEYSLAAERANYLDAQHQDLSAALETLEQAISKIDRETKGRFKDTFDRVNSGIQALYPRLFGGGQAYLELSSSDLLETGVRIMAKPPGKRVSSITLLSGGEKAMTAVALIFSIFQLNPAPFCLLDEVDAPLDEANVGRLALMVQEMSEKVQFLCVSHNKATMEAASQLSGVTMREPGVSRLVSVDLAEATRLVHAD